MIFIANCRRKSAGLEKEFPNATILDLTSTSPYKYGKILSPFYPHGNIPVPFTPGVKATCVEAIWQGLKVFRDSDVDVTLFENTRMSGLKRTIRRYGPIIGHRKGLNSDIILNYHDARFLIYLPTYKWVLENVPEVRNVVMRIKEYSLTHDLVFLDYNVNTDIHDISKPLSHALLVKLYIEEKYPSTEL